MEQEPEHQPGNHHQQEQQQEQNPSPPPPRFRKDDLVQSIDDPHRHGYVIRVPDSDPESSDSDPDSDSDSDSELAPGTSRVSWTTPTPSHSQSLANSKLHLLDRCFSHGDLVVLTSDPLSQSGFIVNLHLLVDVAFRYASVSWITREVDSRLLRRVRPLMEGDYVLRDHWLGRVDEVVDNVTLAFEDGSKCIVLRADPESLVLKKNGEEEVETLLDYYPGATVREKSVTSMVYRRAKWLRGQWTHGKKEATVVKVDTSYVMVTWLSSGSGAGYSTTSSGHPAEKQKPRDLILLPRYSEIEWEVGDITLEVERDQGSLLGELRKLRKFQVGRSRQVKKVSAKKMMKNVARDGYSGMIIRTRSFADVLWQDGSWGLKIPTTELQDSGPFKFNEFWPESYVLENVGDGEVARVGVVKSVDVKQRTARVKWFKAVEAPEVPREFDCEEVVSVFELSDHPDYSHNLGDIVVRLSSPVKAGEVSEVEEEFGGETEKPGEDAGEADGEATREPGETNDEPGETEVSTEKSGETEEAEPSESEVSELTTEEAEPGETEVSEVTTEEPGEAKAELGETVSTEKEEAAGEPGEAKSEPGETKAEPGEAQKPGETEADNLSWVGTIVGFEDGDIKVKWADGVVSKVAPQFLYVVHRPNDDESSDDEEEDDDDARSWETVGSEEERRILEDDPEEETPPEPEASNSSSQGALNFVLGFASRVFSAVSDLASKRLVSKPTPSENDSSFLENGDEHPKSEEEESEEEEEPEVEEPEVEEPEVEEPEVKKLPEDETPEAEGDEELEENFTPSPEKQAPDSIKQFDVVSDASDHQFSGRGSTDVQSKSWMKVVHKEWSILQKNLPDSIFVRMYEDQMNLMRAVIIGAAGTPYEDGLFVFDFHLPHDYPNHPPLGHYHSFGLYLNPNLYADGKICLSLLNTWRGKETELWTPGSSNVLQVLLSIQGLVLNSKPYFNEADFDRYMGTDGGEMNAIEYNESAFVLSCKTMLYLLRRPPMHLEELIKAHFRSRATKILSTCKAYYNGVPVGALGEERSTQSSEAPAGFKLLIRKLVPMLVAAFQEIGATGCDEFLIED